MHILYPLSQRDEADTGCTYCCLHLAGPRFVGQVLCQSCDDTWSVAGEALLCYKCVSGLDNMIGYEDCGDMGTRVRLLYSVIIITIIIIITGAGDM